MDGNLLARPQPELGFDGKEPYVEVEVQLVADKPSTIVISEAPAELYQYRPLLAQDAIRIVELLPGLPQEPIRVALQHRTLSDLPTCSAVSYEWGSNVREHDVHCGGGVIKVTANLSLLLSKFRTPESSQLLWIDAICINQDDIDERSQQVQIMGSIYTNAAEVLLWIGDDKAHTGDVIPVIHGLAERKSSLNLEPGTEQDDMLPYDVLTESGIDEWTVNIMRPDFSHTLTSLSHLLSSSYFRRLWIIQEIFLSSKATVICGQRRIDWKVFYNAAVFVLYCYPLRQAVEDNWSLLAIVQLGELSFKPFSLDMARFFDLFVNAKVTDPRDYVYGLLGVLESRSLDPGIEVDYSSTIEEVFQRATVRFFARKQGLGVFSRECVEPGSRPRPTMPSWVRNFGYSQPRFIHRVINEIEEKLGDEQVLFAEGDSLTAHGLIIDSIKQVSGNFMAKNVKRIVLQAFTSHLSVFSEKSRTDVVMAARKTLQSVDCSLNSSLPEQTFFSLLSFWQLEDLGLTLHVLSQNPKFGVIVTTNPKLQRWFPDETENDTQIMDLIPKNVVLQWATEQHSSTEDLANCDSDLRFRLFSEDSALGVNMFTGTKGFLGIGPAGRNSSPDDPPAVHVGDHITLFPTLSKPMILRDRSDGSYTLVGTAHVGNLLEIPWYEGESPKLVPLRLR